MELLEIAQIIFFVSLGTLSPLFAFAAVSRWPKNPGLLEDRLNKLDLEISERDAANAAFLTELEAINETMDRKRRALTSAANRNEAAIRNKEGGNSDESGEALLRKLQSEFGGVTNLR